MGIPERVYIDRIKPDGLQQRVGGLDDEWVQTLIGVLQSGKELDPGQAFYDRKERVYWLWNGHHRRKAYFTLGLPTMPLVWEVGTFRDALLASCAANKDQETLPRQRGDLRQAIETLLSDPEWRRWSSTQIAEHVGASSGYVRELQRQLELSRRSSEIDQEEAREVVRVRQGKEQVYTMQTGAIGRAQPAPAAAADALFIRRGTSYLERALGEFRQGTDELSKYLATGVSALLGDARQRRAA